MTYIDGYLYGQHDALTWLTVPASDDHPLAAFDSRVQMRAAMVCLAHNLAIAAFGERCFQLGNVNGWDEAAVSEGYRASDSWRPGCRRRAT